MKSEHKIILILSMALTISIVYISYTRGVSSDPGRYEELYNSARETIGVLQDYNTELGQNIAELGDIQEQYQQLQSKYEDLNRERTAEIERRKALEETARDINSAMGREIQSGYDTIDSFWREIEGAGDPD